MAKPNMKKCDKCNRVFRRLYFSRFEGKAKYICARCKNKIFGLNQSPIEEAQMQKRTVVPRCNGRYGWLYLPRCYVGKKVYAVIAEDNEPRKKEFLSISPGQAVAGVTTCFLSNPAQTFIKKKKRKGK